MFALVSVLGIARQNDRVGRGCDPPTVSRTGPQVDREVDRTGVSLIKDQVEAKIFW